MKEDFEFEGQEKDQDKTEAKEDPIKEEEKEFGVDFEPEYDEEKITYINEEANGRQREFEPNYEEKLDEKNIDVNDTKQEEKRSHQSLEELKNKICEEGKGETKENNEYNLRNVIKDKMEQIKEKIVGKDIGTTVEIKDSTKEKEREKAPNIKIRMNQKLKIPKQPRRSSSPPSWFLKWIEKTANTEKNIEPEKKDGSIFIKSDEEMKREVLEMLYRKVENDRKHEDVVD